MGWQFFKKSHTHKSRTDKMTVCFVYFNFSTALHPPHLLFDQESPLSAQVYFDEN